jgi:predicted  nucleic acid-binding Zn ribbon protein
MTQSKCPVCNCEKFHVKNPDDEYDVYEFECRMARYVSKTTWTTMNAR